MTGNVTFSKFRWSKCMRRPSDRAEVPDFLVIGGMALSNITRKLFFFFELLRRIAAIQCLIDFIKIEKSNGIREFEYLLKIVKNDNESLIRYKTLRLLAKNPPFKKMESTLNTSEIRNLLWEIISQFSACDSNVRCAAIHLWKLLYR